MTIDEELKYYDFLVKENTRRQKDEYSYLFNDKIYNLSYVEIKNKIINDKRFDFKAIYNDCLHCVSVKTSRDDRIFYLIYEGFYSGMQLYRYLNDTTLSFDDAFHRDIEKLYDLSNLKIFVEGPKNDLIFDCLADLLFEIHNDFNYDEIDENDLKSLFLFSLIFGYIIGYSIKFDLTDNIE